MLAKSRIRHVDAGEGGDDSCRGPGREGKLAAYGDDVVQASLRLAGSDARTGGAGDLIELDGFPGGLEEFLHDGAGGFDDAIPVAGKRRARAPLSIGGARKDAVCFQRRGEPVGGCAGQTSSFAKLVEGGWPVGGGHHDGNGAIEHLNS